ncbi:MAG: hypothetical protein AAGJ29_05970 [Pseudomonadota bacterium]
MRLIIALTLTATIISTGCVRGERALEPVPARLVLAEQVEVEKLKSALGDALGRAAIHLGPDDLSTSTQITVLPPRLTDFETRSPAKPIIFDVFIEDGRCFAIRRQSEDRVLFPDLTCEPADH